MINIVLCSVPLMREKLFLCTEMSKTMIYVKHSLSHLLGPILFQKKAKTLGFFIIMHITFIMMYRELKELKVFVLNQML